MEKGKATRGVLRQTKNNSATQSARFFPFLAYTSFLIIMDQKYMVL